MLFQGFFEKFLESRDVAVTRCPPLEKRGFLFCSNCGDRIALLKADEEIVLSAQERTKLYRESVTANLRTKFESALRQLNAFVRRAAITAPNCFVSFAWGNRGA
jgi:hypothetical protein